MDLKNRKTTIGFAALTILAVITLPQLSTITAEAETGTVVSYCGTPEWFTQFNQQTGYTPNERCTGVQIQGYQIDMSKDNYDADRGGWGCYADYNVYKIQSNGDLKKVAEGNLKKDIKINENLEIETGSAKYFNYYNCEAIQTSYDFQIPGSIELSNDLTQEKLERGETGEVTVDLVNKYDQVFEGTVNTEICGGGAFDSNVCTSRSEEVVIGAGDTRSFTYTVSTDQVSGKLDVSTSVDGKITSVTDDWQGVNFDCDGDGQIERVEDCKGFKVSGSGASVEAEIVAPSFQTRFQRLVRDLDNFVKSVLSDLLPR